MEVFLLTFHRSQMRTKDHLHHRINTNSKRITFSKRVKMNNQMASMADRTITSQNYPMRFSHIITVLTTLAPSNRTIIRTLEDCKVSISKSIRIDREIKIREITLENQAEAANQEVEVVTQDVEMVKTGEQITRTTTTITINPLKTKEVVETEEITAERTALTK